MLGFVEFIKSGKSNKKNHWEWFPATSFIDGKKYSVKYLGLTRPLLIEGKLSSVTEFDLWRVNYEKGLSLQKNELRIVIIINDYLLKRRRVHVRYYFCVDKHEIRKNTEFTVLNRPDSNTLLCRYVKYNYYHQSRLSNQPIIKIGNDEEYNDNKNLLTPDQDVCVVYAYDQIPEIFKHYKYYRKSMPSHLYLYEFENPIKWQKGMDIINSLDLEF